MRVKTQLKKVLPIKPSTVSYTKCLWLIGQSYLFFCLISGVQLVTRVTPSCLMGNVFLTVSICSAKCTNIFEVLILRHEIRRSCPWIVLLSLLEVSTLCNDYHHFFPPLGTIVDCMWSWLRYAGRLEHCQVHFPLTFPYIFCLLSTGLPLTESSKCDNRGVVSSSARPCSCKVCVQPVKY